MLTVLWACLIAAATVALAAGAFALGIQLGARRVRTRCGPALAAAQDRVAHVTAAAAAQRHELETRHEALATRLRQEAADARAQGAGAEERLQRLRAHTRQADARAARQRLLDEAVANERERALALARLDQTTLEAALAEAVAARMEDERRHSALLALERAVAAGRDADAVRAEAVELAARTLGVSLWGLFELDAAGSALRLTTGGGWNEGRIGRATLAAHSGGLGGFALQAGVPVIVDSLVREARFVAPPLLIEHRAASVLLARVTCRHGRGALIVLSDAEERRFAPRDAAFLEGVALVYAAVAERERGAATLSDARAQAEAIADATLDGVLVLDEFGRVQASNVAARDLYGCLPAELTGRGIGQLLAQGDGAGEVDIAAGIQASFNRFRGIRGFATGQRSDGSTFHAQVVVGDVRLAVGRRFVVVIRDLASTTGFPAVMREPWRRFAASRPSTTMMPRAIAIAAAPTRSNHMLSRVFDAAAPTP